MLTHSMLAAALAISMPAMAQTTDSTGAGGMQSGMAAGNSMAGTDGMASKMSKSHMAAMKKCQAMPSDKMMKNKMCMKMQKMHSDMASPSM